MADSHKQPPSDMIGQTEEVVHTASQKCSGVNMDPAAVEFSPNSEASVPASPPRKINNHDRQFSGVLGVPMIEAALNSVESPKFRGAENLDKADLQNDMIGLEDGDDLDSDHGRGLVKNSHSDVEAAVPNGDVLHTGKAVTAPNVNNTFALPLDQNQALHEGNDYNDGDDQTGDGGDDMFSDPGYADSTATSYCSTLRSEAEDYYYEHGRRYHGWAGGRYLLPNDDQELNREDMKHHMWRLVLDGGLHLAPIGEHPHKILDIGTGSGIWAMQTADAYPSAEVIGFDISPVQPSWVPSNLQFEVDDLEQEWLWKANSFDLIHCRFMFLSVRDWPAMLQQAYRTLKPGGYVELSELDLHPGPAIPGMPYPPVITKWFSVQGQILKGQGFDMRIASTFKRLLINAGFEAVVEEVRDVPWGHWPKDPKPKMIGYWHIEQLKKGLHGIIVASLSRAGWQPMEIEVFIAKLKQEMDEPRWMIKDQAYVVYGRKPLQ